MAFDSAKRVINGTWGEIWLDGQYVAECYKFSAKDSYTHADVAMAGRLRVGKKLTRIEGTGSVGMHKINSRMAEVVGQQVKAGIDPHFTILAKLADPDAYGAERIIFTDVTFDDLTLMDWEVGVNGTIEAPFTFGDYEFTDMIEV